MLLKVWRKVKTKLMEYGIIEPKIEFKVTPEEFKELMMEIKANPGSNVPKWIDAWCRARIFPAEIADLKIETIEKLIEIAEKEKEGKELTKEEQEFKETYKEFYEYVKKNLGMLKEMMRMYSRCVEMQYEYYRKMYL